MARQRKKRPIAKRRQKKRGKPKLSTAPSPPGAEPVIYKTQMAAAQSNHIRNWRLFRGITTQGELAQRSTLTRPQISRLESGNLNYRQDHLEKICAVLGTTPADLISTDPLKTADIITIYKRLNPRDKAAVESLISSLAPAQQIEPVPSKT